MMFSYGPLRGAREVALSLCMIAGLAGWGTSTASAAPVPIPANATLSTLIGLNATGGVQIGNLVFSDFFYQSSPSTGSNPAPTASQVSVSAAPGSNPGFTFSSFWQAAGGSNQDSIIRYSVTATSGLINQVNLGFNGAAPVPDPAVPTPITRASVVETVSTLSGGGPGTTLGQTSVSNSTSGGTTTTNNSTFAVVPNRSSIYVSKDIQVNSSPTGVSTISWVDNTYNTVPEPASIGLMGAFGIGLLARRRRA